MQINLSIITFLKLDLFYNSKIQLKKPNKMKGRTDCFKGAKLIFAIRVSLVKMF